MTTQAHRRKNKSYVRKIVVFSKQSIDYIFLKLNCNMDLWPIERKKHFHNSPKSWKFNQQIKNELEKNQHPPVYFALTLQPVLSL